MHVHVFVYKYICMSKNCFKIGVTYVSRDLTKKKERIVQNP